VAGVAARPPMYVLLLISLALAGLSLLLPSVPTTDPWGWIDWGRQIVHLDLNTIGGPPSWKPLPVLFTTPLSLLGGAAPAGWLVISRAGGVLALALAYRLGARLAGPVAGGLAALGLLLIGSWVRQLAFGYTDGLAVAFLLWAVISHLDGYRGRALVLAFLVSLARPEAWAFFFPYAVFVGATDRSKRVPAAALTLLSPLLWLLPDWWGSGQLFHAANVARVNFMGAGAHPGLHVVQVGLGLVALPIEVLALAAIALAVRRRNRTVLVLGVGVGAWIAVLALATEARYPGSGNFLVMPMAILCVLGGVGAAWLSKLTQRWAPRGAVAVVLVAGALPLADGRAEGLANQASEVNAVAHFQNELDFAVSRAGGLAVLRCGTPVVPARLWWNAGDLAWMLDIPLDRVGTIAERRLATLRGLGTPSVLFVPLGAAPPDDPRWVPTHAVGRPGLAIRRLTQAGTWRVLAVQSKAERHKRAACRGRP
jgi:hypothetical protein